MRSFNAGDANSLDRAAVLCSDPVLSCDDADEGILVTPNVSDLLQMISVIKGGI